MKEDKIKKKSNKGKIFIRVIIIFFSSLILCLGIMTIIFFATPSFASAIVRSMAPGTYGTPPLDYENISSQVIIKTDMEYPSEHKTNTFDIYYPNSEESLDVILFAHGGGFVSGDKEYFKYQMTYLAAQGYFVISMNYLLASNGNIFIQTKQVSDMFDYIPVLANEYSINEKRIILGGTSAGAFLVANFMTAQFSEEYAKLITMTPSPNKNNIIAAFLYSAPFDIKTFQDANISGFAGVMLDQVAWGITGYRNWRTNELISKIRLQDFVNNEFPPIFITDGNKGSFEAQARTYEQALIANNVQYEALYFDNKEVGHSYMLDMKSEESMLCFTKTLSFLAQL